MRRALGYLLFVVSLSAFAEDHRAEVHAAKRAFEDAYEKNDLATYFGFYAEDGTVFFGGAPRGDMPGYRKLWGELMAAGGTSANQRSLPGYERTRVRGKADGS
jgi:ketosteroid isomerase-like protein